MERAPRVLFFGMQGNFSFPSLQALVESGVEICAVIVPAPGTMTNERGALHLLEKPRSASYARPVVPMLNTISSHSLMQLAWTHSIPLWEVTRLSDPETVATLAAYQPDIVCVSCFSQRIPRLILEIPRLGSLNVHPSLLPANRGPVPLFWTFREGREQTGVTIHLMDEGLDKGDILAQRIVPVPTGMCYSELESQCAQVGGTLVSQVAWELFQGRAVRKPQDEAQSSYHSFPEEADFAVAVAEWDAEHVYRFICGVGDWGEPIRLYTGNEVFETMRVISYSHKNINRQRNMGKDYFFAEDNVLWLRCKTGWISVVPMHRLT